MSRPYLSASIDDLEGAFARSKERGDASALQDILSELAYRRTTRAQDLRIEIEKHLASINGESRTSDERRSGARKRTHAHVQSDLFGQDSSIVPTQEQATAIDSFRSGHSLKINAFAGTGKTSTLQLLARATSAHGQYIAFNKAIVRDAKGKFPKSVNCSTTHGLAFKALASRYSSDGEKLTGRINANQLAEVLSLKRWRIDKDYSLAPRSQGFLILETIRRFAHSGDREPHAKHVPTHGHLVAAPEPTLAAVRDVAVQGAKYVWGKMQDPNDPIPLGHDGYLKLWALSEPTINAEFILLDEAQDTNPVVLDVLVKQAAQMIYVGDRFQQIYEWRGAVNAMASIATDRETYLTTSFRFGTEIADAASRLLVMLGEKRPLLGNPKLRSRIGPTSASTILARTNASTITAVIDALDANQKPHLVGGNADLMEMLRGVQHLKANEPSNIPDFFGFANWNEVVEFARSGEGAHLQTFVNLVEERGERQLMWALNRTVNEDKADVTISTVHKAKGREWKSVRLMDDFLPSKPSDRNGSHESLRAPSGQDPAELRLLYVAITRAKEAIEIPPSALQAIGLEPRATEPRAEAKPRAPSRENESRPSQHRPNWKPPEDWKPQATGPSRMSASQRPNERDAAPPKPRSLWQRIFGD